MKIVEKWTRSLFARALCQNGTWSIFQRRGGRQGFLLVEAMLAAVAIAVGLVFISGGIGASLRALTRLQQADRRLRLAAMTLDQAEVEAQAFHGRAERVSCFDPPDAAYRWDLAVAPAQVSIDGETVPVSAVTLTVSGDGRERGATRLHTVWPAEWTAAP